MILDEPFRGLERHQRQELLARARRLWAEATLLCITHDIEATLTFERVLALDQGRVVEDGCPIELAHRPNSLFGSMLRTEQKLHDEVWANSQWRHFCLERGRLRVETKGMSA